MTNPLLDFNDLPLFDQIRPEHVAPAVDALLAEAEAALADGDRARLPGRLERDRQGAGRRHRDASAAPGAPSATSTRVADTPELRAAYNEALPRVTEFWTRLGSDERLYAKYKAIDPATLNAEQRQAHKNAMRNFVLGGAELQGAAKERFAEIQERQAELSQKFSENALDATDAFAYYASDRRTRRRARGRGAGRARRGRGRRQGRLQAHAEDAQLPAGDAVRHSSALRETLYRAYVTRASDQGDPKFDNTALIREILALRQEEAQLLGYRNFGEVSVVPKMAESPEQVIEFLRDLAAKARPYARTDVADLRAFAAEQLGLADPQPWDWTYIGEKLKEARYAFSEQEVKQYFTAPKVLAGLFKIVETLFEVAIRRD